MTSQALIVLPVQRLACRQNPDVAHPEYGMHDPARLVQIYACLGSGRPGPEIISAYNV